MAKNENEKKVMQVKLKKKDGVRTARYSSTRSTATMSLSSCVDMRTIQLSVCA